MGLFLFKFLWFDLQWCLATTFSSFSYPTTYLSKLFLASVLVFPLVAGLPRWVATGLAAATDLFLVANLLYFRTYFTIIPLDSYALAGNLRDFTDSILASLRWADAVYPLTTGIATLAVYRLPRQRFGRRDTFRYLRLPLLTALAIGLLILCNGGFRRSYEKMLIHRQMSVTPTYSIPGSLLYEAVREEVTFSPRLAAEIDGRLARQPASQPPVLPAPPRRNIIVILAESFESWVLERDAAGVEITPCLNRLLRERGVVYAPRVQTQVKGGHSIDAQLLVSAGLLPIDDGCWSARYPHAAYPTLVKAFRRRHPAARAAIFTPDNPIVWNQMIVAREFGYDTLLAHKAFRAGLTTGRGSRRRICDGPLFEQCLEKLAQPDLLPQDGSAPFFIQIVTYSGHSPFVIPEELRQATFSEAFPERLRDYLTAANYTDRAIGAFVDSLRRRPLFDDTLIVITGDHEGLASDRAAFASCRAGRGLVSEGRFTPLIVLNAPVSLRYDEIIGQIDIYPTLLDLMGLNDYHWHGLGRSILRTEAPCAAADQHLRIIGDADEATQTRLKEAWSLSDRIIRSDYFRHTGRER